MPPVVIGVVAYAGAAAAGYTVATAVAIGIGAAIATYAVTESMQPDMGSMGEDLGGDQNLTVGGIKPRRTIYGEAVVSGGIVGYGTYTDDESDKWHVMTIALADHECHSVTLHDIEGKLTDAFGMDSRYKINTYLGTQTSVCPVAKRHCDGWTDSHIGFGLTYVTLEVKIDPEFFPNGVNNVRFKIQGKKLYDVRLDSTMGGVGSHRFADATTWEYSANPILAITDFIHLGGYKEQPITRFDWPDIAAQANACDEVVNFTNNAGDPFSEPRFTCNGTLLKSQTPGAALKYLLSSCAGKIYNVAGKIIIKAGVYQGAPTLVLDKTHAAAALSFKPHTPIKDRVNTVRTSFVDPKKYYQTTDATPTENAIYKAADGMKLEQSIDLFFTNSETMCQRIGKNQLEQNRSGFSLRFPLFAIGLLITPGQAISINLPDEGINNEEFKCVDWAWDSKKRTAVLTFGKDSSDLYSDDFEPNEAAQIGNSFVDHFQMPAFATNAITWADATGLRDSQGQLAWNYDENNAEISYLVELRQTNANYIAYNDTRLDPDHVDYDPNLSATNKYTHFYRATTREQFLNINNVPVGTYQAKVTARNRMNSKVTSTKTVVIALDPANIKDMAGWADIPASGADLTDYTDPRISNAEITGFVTEDLYAQEKAVLQSQIDKAITTWFYDGAPTLANSPASDWATGDDKNTHLGDLYYDNNTGYAYRFLINGTTYEWQKVSDSDVTLALANAAKAQDTADGKRRVFVAQPVTPYDVGDLWDTGSGIKRCQTDRTTSENYNGADWLLVSDVTNYGAAAATAQNYAQTNAEAARVAAEAYADGIVTAEEQRAINDATAKANAAELAATNAAINALSTITLISVAGTQTIAGNTITSAGNFWANGVKSQSTIKSGAVASWKHTSGVGAYYMAGLGTGEGTTGHFNEIDYAIYCAGTQYLIRVRGVDKGFANLPEPQVGDVCRVVYDGIKVRFYVNGIKSTYEASALNENESLGFSVSFHNNGGTKKLSEVYITDFANYKAIRDGVTAANVGLGNVDNTSDATVLALAATAAEAEAELARVTAEAYADNIVTAEEARAIADAQAKADAAQLAAQQYSEFTQSNQTLYSINGLAADVMPEGSPFAIGFSRETQAVHKSPEELIPVRKGETLHWEVWAKQTGSSVRAYMGIERYDRNKKPLSNNSGTVYGGLVSTLLTTTWTKYVFSHTLPETHVPYNGSDGKEVCFVRVRLLMNYQSTGQAYYSGYRLYRVQDQQFMPNLVSAGAGTALNVNPLSAIDNGSTAKINIASHTRQYGFGLLTLNAGSISGLAFSTKYYVYYDDPTYTGGTVTYNATTNLQTIAAGNHRIFVSSITTPANGGGSTTPPVYDCITLDMWLTPDLQGKDLQTQKALANNEIDLWFQGENAVKGQIKQSRLIEQKQVIYEIQTSSGAIVRISESTPLELENHVIITPKELTVNVDELATLKGDSNQLVWEKVTRAEIIGEQPVMHISVGNGSFAAGVNAKNRIITHNAQQKP